MNERLLTFLKELTCSLENDELCPRQLQSVGEFFMSYQFQEQADVDNTVDTGFSQTDLIKFITLGWYVYQVIIREDTLQNEILD